MFLSLINLTVSLDWPFLIKIKIMFYICRSSELWWYWSLDVATVLGWFWWILWQHWPSGVSLCWAATWGSSPSIHHLIVWYQSQSDWKASVLAWQVSLMPLSSVQWLNFQFRSIPFFESFVLNSLLFGIIHDQGRVSR